MKDKRIAKGDLPQRTCVVCGRPFAWRKKWARNWESVKFCSERCRRASKGSAPPPAGGTR